MGAYSVLESCEWTGGIVFAKSNIEARRVGASLWGDGEIRGMIVNRRRDLDKYEARGVPASVLVEEGWHFECSGCGVRIDDYNLEENGLSPRHVVGVEGGRVYCSHACRMGAKADEAAAEALGEAFLEMLRDMVRVRFPNADHCFGEHKTHAYVPRWSSPSVVEQAVVSFSFPGMTFGPASLEYRRATNADGSHVIGPVRPDYYCSNGDREAFEKFASHPMTEGE